MIKKTGSVLITEEAIVVTGFIFDGAGNDGCAMDAMKWARERLTEEAANYNGSMKGARMSGREMLAGPQRTMIEGGGSND